MKSIILLLLVCLLPIATIATVNDSARVSSELIVGKVVASPDRVFRVNNRYDEYIKEFKDITVYVAPKLYVMIKIVIKDAKGTRTCFAVDLGVDGSCDRMVKVPGNTNWHEDAETHLSILGSMDESSIQTELDLVSTERMLGDTPYSHRLILWRIEDVWRAADFDDGTIGNMPSRAPEKLWRSFIDADVLPKFYSPRENHAREGVVVY